MYTVNIKQGAYRIDSSKEKAGLNLDNYFRGLLIKYGVPLLNDSCCQQHALFLQSCTFQFTPHRTANVYDMEKYFVRMLVFFGVLTQIQVDAICCPGSTKLVVFTDKLYFTNREGSKKASLSHFITKKLDEFNIPYTNPCC